MKQFLIAAIILAVSTSILTHNGYAQTFPDSGKVTGTQNGTVTKTIPMHTNSELALILKATGGNFGSKFFIVQVAHDCSTFVTVDNISLTTLTIKGVQYSDSSKATTVPVNPADFPCVKAFTSAGVTGVTESLTYSARR